MADRLAIILHTLSSQDNKREWRSKEKEGLTQFLNEEFLYDWKGYAVWDAGNGTVDCHYEARIVVKPTKAVSEDKELARLLAKIPFTTKEKIRDLFARRLQEYLDHEFDYYCTCEDYYQPVVEDFEDNLEYDVKQVRKSYNFRKKCLHSAGVSTIIFFARSIGLSPNGKATDSDSVISRFESL